MCIQTEYIWYTTPKYLYWFRAILGWFSNKKIPSETWTHPPTSIVLSDFGIFFFAQPLNQQSESVILQIGTNCTKLEV